MAGIPPFVSVTRAQGQPGQDPGTDFRMLIIGTSSDYPGSTVGAIHGPYYRPDALVSDFGIGDGVDCGCHALITVDGYNPTPPGIYFMSTKGMSGLTDGVRGDTLTPTIPGGSTAVITKTASTHPLGTWEPGFRVSVGGIVGVAGIILEATLDRGRTWLPTKALGTDTTFEITIPNPGGVDYDTDVIYDIAPATTNAAYVALAVELRADTLGHLANVTAHDGADTSAAQILLAASSPPGTVSASTAVVNLAFNALVSHVTNITTMHDGPDLVAYTALALLSAATTPKEGIDLANALKAILNTHDAVALAADDDGLKGATLSIASPTTYTAAAHFLAGGVAALDVQPRRLRFVIDGGGTPANMADSVTITGFDYAGNAQTETALSLTGLGTIDSVKAWKGTGLACAFVAADGTAATFTIGYAKGGHNSADATYTIAAADATYGTLVAGDYWMETKTTPPQWAVADLYTAGTPGSGALITAAQYPADFGMIIITEPFLAADVATVSAGLAQAKIVKGTTRITVIGRRRDEAVAESDSTYITTGQTFRLACSDEDDIALCSGAGWLTDAFRSYVLWRSFLPELVAFIQGMSAIAGSQGERIAQNPGLTARGPLRRFTVLDPVTGTQLGHDERFRGGLIEPVSGKGGFVTVYHESATGRQGTYVCVNCPTLYGNASTVLLIPDSRVSNGIERTLYGTAFDFLGGANVVTNGIIEEDIRDAMATEAMAAIKRGYANEIANPEDPNLVTVDPNVTVDGSNFVVKWYVNDELFVYTNGVVVTIANARG